MLRRSFLTTLVSTPALVQCRTHDARNRKLAHPKTHFDLRSYGTKEEWDRRKRHLRRQILSSAGMFPVQNRDLRLRVIRQIYKPGYVIEVLLLETMPGYFIGCTVYRPIGDNIRRPAVLIPHGHWKRGRVEHLPSYSVPALGINLALQGYVAVSWDMAGYNDANQTRHSFGSWREQLWGFNPLGLELWNSISVLDYTASRTDVDASRIACTGASGGGTQTILLCAVDDRIACSAPVNMISAHYQGADPCEEAPNLRLGTNNVEIAVLMAPRPMLVVSCTGDWTRNTPVKEYPWLRQIYGLYGSEACVGNAHFDAEHNYDRRSREAVYAFFAEHMLGRPGAKPQDIDVGTIDTSDLLAYAKGVQPPHERLEYSGIFEQWVARWTSNNALTQDRDLLRDQLRYSISAWWPDAVEATSSDGRLILHRPGYGDQVPARWFEGGGSPVVVVHERGAAAAVESDPVRSLLSNKRAVLAIDVFQTGAAEGSRDRGGRWFLSYNQTDDANRVQDILTALSYAHRRSGRSSLLMGIGKGAIWSIFAAAIAPVPIEVSTDIRGFTGTDEQMRRDFFVPCIQQAGGLQAALRVLGRERP